MSQEDVDFILYFKRREQQMKAGLFIVGVTSLVILRTRRILNLESTLFAIVPCYDISDYFSRLTSRYNIEKHVNELESTSALRQWHQSREMHKDMPITINNQLNVSIELTDEEKEAFVNHVESYMSKSFLFTSSIVSISSIYALLRRFSLLSSIVFIGSTGYTSQSHFQEINRYFFYNKENYNYLPNDSLLKKLLQEDEEGFTQLLQQKSNKS